MSTATARTCVFSYRNRKQADDLAKQSRGRVKVVDEKSLYLRLKPGEDEPEVMYELLKAVLGAGPPRIAPN